MSTASDQTEQAESAAKASRPLRRAKPRARGVLRYAEGFAITLYASEDGSEIEAIWNSRDGAVPLQVAVRDPNVEMTLARLVGGDPIAPLHVPNIGDRIWVDMTQEIAFRLAEGLVEMYWEAAVEGGPNLQSKFPDKVAAAEAVAAEWVGGPDIAVVTPALQRALLRRRLEHMAIVQAAHRAAPLAQTQALNAELIAEGRHPGLAQQAAEAAEEAAAADEEDDPVP